MESSLLALLVIIDLSGSMSQTFENSKKSEVVRQTLRETVQTLPEKSRLEFLYFGTEPQLKCKDLKAKSFPQLKNNLSHIQSLINTLEPGSFGKTPLAKSIEQLPVQVQKKNINRVIILTDGADSCGGDACQALLAADEKLQKQGFSQRQIHVNIIGIDLQASDQTALSCFQNIKNQLKAIDLEFNSHSDRKNLAFQLNKNLPVQLPPGMGGIKILGANEDFEFTLKNGARQLKWTGQKIFAAKPGDYTLGFSHVQGRSMTITLKEGKVSPVPIGQLVKDPTVQLNIANKLIDFYLVPTELTIASHPQLSLNSRIFPGKDSLFFGEYAIKVIRPDWMAGEAPAKIKFAIAEQKNISEVQLLGSTVSYLEFQETTSPVVVEVNSKKYLISEKNLRLPYYSNQKFFRFFGNEKKPLKTDTANDKSN